MSDLRNTFKTLINDVLPATYQSPVRFNHCFNRIILDWLFQDVWYYHLDKKKTAISQLNDEQLEAAIIHMNEWLTNHDRLVQDNLNSLRYRGKLKEQ